MRIHNLHLQNFRGFSSFELDLHPEVTVLIGVNGAGKSTLLDALAVAAGTWFIGLPDVPARSIHDEEIHRQVVETSGTANLEPRYPVRVEAEGTVLGNRFRWARALNQTRGKTTHGEARAIKDLGAAAQAKLGDAIAQDLPVIAYYGTGRLWFQKRASASKAAGLGSRLHGYVDCLEPAANHKLFEAWMRQQEEERLQQVADAAESGRPLQLHTPLLDAIDGVVRACVPGSRRLFYSVRYRELRIAFEDGRLLPFRLLSDGYRNFFGMVADLAWRSVQLNPHHLGAAPAKAQGIVLIDEVDLHLHPAWQRAVLDQLRCAFPLLQFVVTTHSPQVLASARPEWVRVLAPGQTRAPGVGATFGKDANAILRDVMGIPDRPEWMQARLDRVARLLEDEDLEQARAVLEQVKVDLGEHDQAVLGLEWELHDLEAARAAD